MKYKVGDKVKIREDFNDSKSYKICPVIDMNQYRGEIATVKSIDYSYPTSYRMQEFGWDWSDDMLESVPTKPRIAEILGVEVGEKFNIGNVAGMGNHSPYWIEDKNNIISKWGEMCTGNLVAIINNPSLLQKIEKPIPKEVTMQELEDLLGYPIKIKKE